MNSAVTEAVQGSKNLSLNRAVTITHSWLRSFGVEHEVQYPHILINGVKVGFDAEASVKLDMAAIIDAYDVSRVLAEIERLGSICGFTVPEVNTPYTRRTDIHDHLGRSLSLNAVAKSARIPDSVFLQPETKRIIQMEADRAWRRYRDLADRYTMEKEEFRHLARILAIPFFHRGADSEDEDQSLRKLATFLSQEFGRWAQVSWADLPSQVPNIDWIVTGLPIPGAKEYAYSESGYEGAFDWDDLASCNVAAYSSRVAAYVWDPTDMPEYEEKEELTEKTIRRLGREHNRDVANRDRAAREALDVGLASMPHEEMLRTLEEVSDSPDWGKDVRMAARARIAKHKKSCPHCAASTSTAT